MACDRIRPLLPRLVDRALGPLRRLMVTRHVAHCEACAAQLEELEAMRTAIRTRLPYHRAPPGLAARIGAALPREAPARAVAPLVPHAGGFRRHRAGRRAGRCRADPAGGWLAYGQARNADQTR